MGVEKDGDDIFQNWLPYFLENKSHQVKIALLRKTEVLFIYF